MFILSTESLLEDSKGRHYNATQKLGTQYVSTTHRRETTYVDPDHKTYRKTLILSITGEVGVALHGQTGGAFIR